MKKETIDIVRQYINDCMANQNEAHDFYFIVKSNDDSLEYRSTVPYEYYRIELIVAICCYCYKRPDNSLHFGVRPLCVTDERDSQTFNYKGWTFSISGMTTVWDHGRCFTMNLTKEGREVELIFKTVESMVKYWDMVNLAMKSDNDEELHSTFKPYIPEKIIMHNKAYVILGH